MVSRAVPTENIQGRMAMFRNYLTYQFVLNFDRACSLVELPVARKLELLRCSQNLVRYFAASIEAKDERERSKAIVVALLYLRDCKSVLNEASVELRELAGPYEVLKSKLERMCGEAGT